MTWSQTYFLFGQGLLMSAFIAGIPILVFLFLLGAMRKPASFAGLCGLGVTFMLATVAYRMPLVTALSAASEGMAFGLFPISWIVFWAIVLFRVTVETGQFEIIKGSIGKLTGDPRLQALLIAFAFGAFLEGAAGFGTPVAIAATMLVGLGFSAFSASAICLLANTAPVAFGSIGIPVVTLALTTGLSVERLSTLVGQLCTLPALILPGYLVVAMWGFRSLSGIWLPATAAGMVFAAVQLAVSNLVGPQLTNILASLATVGVLIFLLRYWKPRNSTFLSDRHTADLDAVSEVNPVAQNTSKPIEFGSTQIFYAWLPYGLLIICVLLWGWKPVHVAFESMTLNFPWPYLHDVVQRMPPIVAKPSAYHAVFNLNWFAASGTSCMTAAILSAICFRMSLSHFARLLIVVTRQLLLPTLTVTSVLATAFLMNYCGATATLGIAFATAGAIFPLVSPLLGWLGVFLTGSDTSANALFGTLQTVTASRLGFDPYLMAAANSVGGVMGKMISLQTIAVATAATGISTAYQARLFRFALKHSIILLCFVALLNLLLAYARSS